MLIKCVDGHINKGLKSIITKKEQGIVLKISGFVAKFISRLFVAVCFVVFAHSAFKGCVGLTGPISSGLFGALSGEPAARMFFSTFYNCANLTSIPSDLFGTISGTLQVTSIASMFNGCSGLRGYSAQINGKYLYEIWPSVRAAKAYAGCTGLTDYDDIPSTWK